MSGQPGPPPPPAGGSMMLMFLFMILMTFLLLSSGFRDSLGGMADPYLSPWLPDEKWFILTVFVLGSISMFVNTVLRNLLTDPLKMAHNGHRQGQIRKMMNEARIGRDTILLDKAQTMQQHMMPEQFETQMAMMKPMMFTMIFIIAIFAWMGSMVNGYKVDYISLPWSPEWHLTDGKFLFFPAWICAYICMSAPLGRVVDRHLKLFRYRTHPVVLAGESLKEPLLSIVNTPAKKSKAAKARESRARNRQRNGPRKTKSKESQHQVQLSKKSSSAQFCPECNGDFIERDGPSLNRCKVCRFEWR